MSSEMFVFPGQGAQYVGMGKDVFDNYPIAKQTFEEADDALNEKLSDLIFSGSEEELSQTRNTQPALVTLSVAILRVVLDLLKKDVGQIAKYVAGHSLGEYAALCAADAISFSDAIKLLRLHGIAMQNAMSNGAMVALIGADIENVRKMILEIGDCDISNDNGGGQVVVSGLVSAMEKVVATAKSYGIGKAIPLKVSGAFHSRFMQPAFDELRNGLESIKISAPKVPVIANVTASFVTSPVEIRELLAEQLIRTVRWRESVIFASEHGISKFVEIGAGSVLSGLAKKIVPNSVAISIHSIAGIEKFLSQ